MPREIVLDGQRRHVDVVEGTTREILTPWGVVLAKPGDVLLPWGRYAVPVPGGLLDALSNNPQPSDDEPPRLEDLGRAKLIGIATRQFPKQARWFKMSRETLVKELRERGL